ncbi:chy and ring finger domain-containing protein [Colletotrichum karsti]|uniref:Chy and ring finger domain-containing protein n=1 Tax=Colletotrichum karsti TaxID=1095194 RepID=A0A9P6IA09_9PEZI|nr:chy and ring finger domain-containing protein [Colletotrichum karsti]KAF9878512.1 chy and ring finger domain-containing protein [Colletotrichum karsti]
MPSLVSNLIINPVLRQARRFSEISRRAPVPAGNPSSDSVAVASDTEPSVPRHATDAPPALDSPLHRHLEETSSPISVEPEQPLVPPPPAPAPTESPPMTIPMQVPTSVALPADDGMGALRKRLISIQTEEIPAEEKAKRMHEVLMESYRKSRIAPLPADSAVESLPQGAAWQESLPIGPGPLDSLKFWNHKVGEPSNRPEPVYLNDEDLRPTYAPPKLTMRDKSDGEMVLGCQHYMRNVKLQCSTCQKWYTCRFCHDSVEDHTLIRKETKNMLSARYYCNVCKLWDDHPAKGIYHCDECGICRKGRGIGKDFFHCKKCCACISVSIQHSHKCIERSTDCDCPICGDYLFTSPKPVVFMPCGHSIHSRCYDEHLQRSYKCPICNKSLLNMESQFRQLELAILSQPMPPEFRDTRATVLCNDCSGRSSVPYHWLGLKCAICTSYNTVELQMSGGRQGAPSTPAVPGQAQPSPAAAEAAAPTGASQPTLSGRRRHSSHAGPEARMVALNRLTRAGDQTPGPGSLPTFAPFLVEEDENEMDILNLWRRDQRQDEEEEEEEEESESMSTEEEEDDDEDDEDDDFMLIGHR